MARAAAVSVAQDLDKLKMLSAVDQRKAAAILGALVADAASKAPSLAGQPTSCGCGLVHVTLACTFMTLFLFVPLHWIYNQGKVADLAAKGHSVEFYPTSHCPFYCLETGRNSCYGDELFVMLKSLAENKGLDTDKLADDTYKFFGPGTEYEEARRQLSGPGVLQLVLMFLRHNPVNGPWTNHCLKTFMSNRAAGKTPEADGRTVDPDGLVKVIPLVALLSGKPEMLESVEKAVRVTQTGPLAVGFALGGARILQHIIQNGGQRGEAVEACLKELRDPGRTYKCEKDETVAQAIEKAMAAFHMDHKKAVKQFGMACNLPASFYGMVHGVITAKSYMEAIREEVLAAGDSCSRGAFIGACVAAHEGLNSIPLEWVEKLKNANQVLEYIHSILN